MLNDAHIRVGLKKFIANRGNKPRLLIEELRIHDGNAIADVVAVYDFMHGYEIKGCTDKVSRIKTQADFYNKSFPYLTLVTTSNHLAWALDNLDPFWGIIVASSGESGVKLNYHRGAKTNPYFDIELSLSMLWKEELLDIGHHINASQIKKHDSRSTLASKIFPVLNKKVTAAMISDTMVKRYLKIV